MHCCLGDSRYLSFWFDRWIDGRNIEQIAPNLLSYVLPAARCLLIADALPDYALLEEIRGVPSIPAIAEFIELWDLLSTW